MTPCIGGDRLRVIGGSAGFRFRVAETFVLIYKQHDGRYKQLDGRHNTTVETKNTTVGTT